MAGRPPKLSEEVWNRIRERLVAGESYGALAKEYKISKGSISARFAGTIEPLKAVANQIVNAEVALKQLSIPEQRSVLNLAHKLQSISEHLACAAEYGASTAHRLSGIANAKIGAIDDIDPLNEESMQALKGIAVLTRMANESSDIGLNLLKANKEAIDDINKRSNDRPIPTLTDFYKT